MFIAGSSSVSVLTSKSSVTYSADAGTLITGLNSRSNRVLAPLGPSFALTWNAAFDPVNVARVVHGIVLAPPACEVAQPAGSDPGAAPSKSSAKMVVGIGVPVAWVNGKVTEPCA